MVTALALVGVAVAYVLACVVSAVLILRWYISRHDYIDDDGFPRTAYFPRPRHSQELWEDEYGMDDDAE